MNEPEHSSLEKTALHYAGQHWLRCLLLFVFGNIRIEYLHRDIEQLRSGNFVRSLDRIDAGLRARLVNDTSARQQRGGRKQRR